MSSRTAICRSASDFHEFRKFITSQSTVNDQIDFENQNFMLPPPCLHSVDSSGLRTFSISVPPVPCCSSSTRGSCFPPAPSSESAVWQILTVSVVHHRYSLSSTKVFDKKKNKHKCEFCELSTFFIAIFRNSYWDNYGHSGGNGKVGDSPSQHLPTVYQEIQRRR